MGNRYRYAKFQVNLLSSNEIKSIFCPPLFRKRPISFYTREYENKEKETKLTF